MTIHPPTLPAAAQSSNPPLSLDKQTLASASLHGKRIEQMVPDWLIDASPERRAHIKNAGTQLPDWYQQLSVEQRRNLQAHTTEGFLAQSRLDKSMAALESIEVFAEAQLKKALKSQFNIELDVNKTLLCLRRPLQVSVLEIEVSTFEVLKLPMLQAALHNFEAAECEEGAFHRESGFFVAASTADTFQAVTLDMTVTQFLSLCRTLDIGALYQTRVKAFFQSSGTLREQFISSQKTAMRAAAELALLKKDIEPDDYRMLLSVVDGEVHPRLGKKSVWFRDLSLMKHRMTGCVVFSISEQYRYTNDFIVYIPHDPEHPLKRYTSAQMREVFKRKFTARDASPSSEPATAYQRFFSQFFTYADRPYYFSQFTRPAADAPTDPLRSIWVKVVQMIPPVSVFTQIKELPPEHQGKREPEEDPYLDPFGIVRNGAAGIWAANTDLWQYLFEQHCDKFIADARARAVPTADVDANVRAKRLNHLLEFGMLALNMVSMFVPVLGEIMMTVMAGQLLYESFEGAIEWTEGDRQAAKGHLVDVAENLALIGVMAGAGKGLGRLSAAKSVPVIEKAEPVERLDGKPRLWAPDLAPYESTDGPFAASVPDAQGLHRLNGKTYIRQQGKVYQTAFDEQLKQWRILHPTDASAYRPILEHNRLGAWRHTFERPLTWDRLTLLRRIGHCTEAFSDEQLLNIADLSGVSDDALRQMHLDHSPAPLALADTLRLFEADQAVSRIIENIEDGSTVEEPFLLAMSLLPQMPRWPTGRVLEVFDGPGLSGASVKHGDASLFPGGALKAPIQIARADVLTAEMPAILLEALDEQEIVRLLGSEAARVSANRPVEFRAQLVDFLKTRQPTMFEQLYAEPALQAPWISRLQKATPGLGSSAAIRVCMQANAEELARLETGGRLPLRLLEESRRYAQGRRFDHAVVGLHMDNLAASGSQWLALRVLERLPGWSDDVRLEVREGSTHGPLIDSVGSESSRQLKYLVKQGPSYQAFNEHAEALNGIPRQGDNFFASVMHALPDKSRQALGLADVSQSASLRRLVIDHVHHYRAELARLAGTRHGTGKRFKPALRVPGHGLGYYASGRGQGVNPLLVTRVQNVYPGLTDQQAGGFILQQLASGKTDMQIYELLQRRTREWRELDSTLAEWEGESTPELSLQSLIGGRASVVRNIKQSWRESPLAQDHPRYAQLELICDEPLPALTADFSHVRELSVRGRCITDANADSLLAVFPNLEKLRINATSELFSNVPQILQGMPALKRLTLYSAVPFAADMPARLGMLVRIEELTVCSASYQPITFDVSHLQKLRKLEIVAYSLLEWPTGVLELPELQRLSLKDTGISNLPEGLLKGHEKLWSGLSLDWSRFSRENFKVAYEYARTLPVHLIDREAMIRDYCKGELQRLGEGLSQAPQSIFERFFQQWPDEQQRYAAIEALSEQFATLDKQLVEWLQKAMAFQETLREIIGRSNAIHAIRTNWRKGLFKRYGSTVSASTLDLSGLMLSELPKLPADAFSHVRTLLLLGQRVDALQLRDFVSAFQEVQTLNLSGNALHALPIEPGSLARLNRLDLSDNLLVNTQQLQSSLEAFPALEQLDLHNNPLTGLNVGGLSRLKALNLRNADLQAWPAGAEDLAQLTWMDVRNNNIATLPQTLLDSHALINSNLSGNPLTPATTVALRAAQQRIEFEIGLPQGALQAFAEEPVPLTFPPAESGISIARQLLPLPQAAVGEGETLMINIFQRMQPAFTAEQASQLIGQMRSSGATEIETGARIDAWNQTFETLVRQLNGWLYTREIRGADWVISSQTRSLAAWRILTCWRARLPNMEGVTQAVLNLNGLQLGDIPALPEDFAHVRTLNLTGTRVTVDGANGFLGAFTELRTLELGGNELEALPQSIRNMSALERLELSSNRLYDPELLYESLSGLEHLTWLDVSYNNLESFDVNYFGRLEALDLRNNNLYAWPEGALESEHLRMLNLSRNDITTLPVDALDGSHEQLMNGTDLTDNYNLSEESLERLRAYQAEGERHRVLGFSRTDLEEMVDDAAGGLTETTDSIESDETLPIDPSQAQYKAPWLANLPPEQLAARDTLWEQLAAEPDSAAFFHLLERLQDSREFRVANADLTRRVWTVMEAAAADTELREVIFAGATTHGTCVDGRILTFSGLETKVFTHNALRDLPSGRSDAKGGVLLSLSRRLFRLDKVDELAKAAAARSGFDEAEVRLGYRIGLTDGWEDGLELPGQPKNMTYASGVSPQQLVEARTEVSNAERSDRFLEDLIQRDYWVEYLQEKFPEDFRKLEELDLLGDAEDDVLSADDPEYLSRLFDRTAKRNVKMIELSQQEIDAINAAKTPVAGSSSHLSNA
ncbi:NEL-type E3 ubiquitin ligase domain-containing protein [Pseudomonas sp. NPDC089741]|uniref:NEL-type E3 ubiquitin ligase domain-containing protein n=1 Tax=Pseudomonas sp. NPDC089741 TaxID=3364470 RepID=UPI003809AE67